MSNISQKTMFFTTKRENKRFQPLFGLIFAFISFFWLFSATSANAAIVWEGVDLGRVIDENFYNADFGRAADVYGNYWVITAPSFKTVYVLQKSGDTWSLAAKLTPSDSATVEGYGQSVAIHGNTIVVGTTQLGRQGSVYIYESAGAWSDMTETYKISGQPPVYTIMAGSVSYFNEWSDYFGYAVDVYNDTVVVGAHSSNINQGLVYVYQKPADGWASGTAVPVVLNPSATGFSETYAMFGRAVALNSNYLLATSLSYTGASGPHPAKGYLFAYSLPVTSSSVPMVLHSSDQNAYDGFGHSLDLTESGVAVVGATSASSGNGASGGAAYVFESPWNDGNVENAKLTGSTSRNGDSFGSSVSIVDDRILVGAPKNDIVYEFNPVYIQDQARPGQISPNYSDDEQGAAYVFVKNNGSWQTGTEMFEITGPRNQRVYFGSQVEQLGDEMLVLPAGGFNNAVQQGLYSFNFSDYQNLKPQAEFVSQPVQANDSSGYVNASVLLTNSSNLPMEMAIDYSFDGISWYAADVWDLVTSSVGSFHPYGPSQVTDITETAGGNLVSFSWDTRFSNSRNQYADDSAFADNNFYLRVRYGIDRDGMLNPYLYTGAGLVSSQFHVQNDLAFLQSPGPITLTAATSSMLVSWPRFYGAGYFVSSTVTAEPVIVPALTTTTFNNLLTNTQYSFQVASYSGSTGALTPYSAVFSAYTAANLPAGLTAVVNSQTEITLNWSGDATEYYADNVTTSSSWIATTTYAFSDLACATDYNFSVKGRNSDGLETAAVTTTARTFDCDGSVSTAGNNTTTPSGVSGNTGSSNGGSSVVIPTVVTSTLAEVSPVSTTTIHVNSDVVNATQMILSEDPNFIGASWIDYTTSTAFILSDGNGEKTVYVKYRSASGGVSDTRSFMLVLANLGGQNSPGDNGQNTTSTLTSSTIQNTPTSTGSTGNTNSSSTNIGNTGSRSTSTSTAGARPVTARPLAAVSGVKIVAPTSSSANTESLEIKLSTTSADNGLIPTAQAAENRGFGSKARGYFTRIFSPKNNRLIALSVIVAIVIIGSGWFYHKPKKDDKTDTNPETTPDKEGQNDKDDKLS